MKKISTKILHVRKKKKSKTNRKFHWKTAFLGSFPFKNNIKARTLQTPHPPKGG